MEAMLWAVIGILAIGAGILSVRLLCYQKQVRHLKRQVEFLRRKDSNLFLTSACPVGETGELVSEINSLIKKLREGQRKLSQANRSYRESITSISHDIRTPLTSIQGYVQMLQDPFLTEGKKREYLSVIRRRLEDLTEMLNQLFEYARLEAKEMEWKPKKVNGGNLFAETISMFYGDFLEKGCEPEVEISNTPCFIFVDPHSFVRIIENLIKNALVHGTGSYKFSMEPKDGQAVVRASNQTSTIEESDMGQIFERFYTTDQSRSRKSTGLGLSIAREFTQQMGGEAQAWLLDGEFTVELRFGLAEFPGI